MNTIENSISEIQKNLEKLDSARNQVIDVTKSSEEITALMIDLLKNIQEVKVIVSTESDSLKKGFVNNEKKVDDVVKGIIDKWQFSISNFEKSLSSFTTQISENINQNGANITINTNSFLEKQDTAFNANIANLENSNKVLDEFRQSLNEFNFYEQIKPIEQKVEEFERLVSKKIHESYQETAKNTNQIATDTLKAVQDLNLPIRIDKLDANISGILTAVNNLNLPIRIDQLDANISGILTAINNLNLPIRIDKLDANISGILTAIKNLNLPIRIDQLDANISGLLAAVQYLQGRLDLVEQNIGHKLKNEAEKQATLLLALENKLETTARKQQTNTYITWGLIIVILFFQILFKLKI
jgi:6-pyruvoyl-tetrahydropterin synthase